MSGYHGGYLERFVSPCVSALMKMDMRAHSKHWDQVTLAFVFLDFLGSPQI